MHIVKFLFNKSVLEGVWSNFLFAIISLFTISFILLFFSKRKIYKIFGLDKKNYLSIFFSNTYVKNAIDKNGNRNLYSGAAVPENEFKTIKNLFDLLNLLGKKDNPLVLFMKFLTFERPKIEYKLSPQNEKKVEADNETNILTIGGPVYNNATSYFQRKSKLFFNDNNYIEKRSNKEVVAMPSLDYDFGILERIVDGDRIIIIAAGFHINGTRGTVKYLTNNWKKLPDNFAYLIKFPHPSKDVMGYKSPLYIKNFYDED
ncbi:MAG: hypothetical protein WC860_08875 [Candidatus Margulisiibacteriota bacterium]|jgi:hypothetical protein